MPPRLLHLAVLASLLPGCKQTDPLYCDPSTPCTDPDRPFCDDDGEYPASEGIKHTCIPDPFASDADAGPDTFCAPNEFIECSDLDTAVYCNEAGSEHISLDCGGPCDAAQGGCQCEADTSTCSDNLTVHCDANGRPEEVEACALGCADTGQRCVDVEPSNDLGSYLDMTDDAPVVVLSDGAVIDTDAGTIENGDGSIIDVPDFQVPAPTGGVPVRVFVVKSLTMGDATVTGGRALAIVSDGDVTIGGHVLLKAGAMLDSGCSQNNAPQCDGGASGSLVCAGSGGGGFGTRGGDGGDATSTTDAINVSGANGGASGGTAELVPLRGGCAGGESDVDPDFGTPGGSGQVVSRSLIRIANSSDMPFIDANGGGSSSNGGGGAGGGILLEAPRVVVESDAGIVANGGGGGCVSEPGSAGRLSTSVAPGGTCRNQSQEGDGGGGGAAADTSPADGEAASSALVASGGGGGGGVGRIRVNVPAPADFSQFGTISPAATSGSLAVR